MKTVRDILEQAKYDLEWVFPDVKGSPSKRIQKQWRKDYPGIKVVLQADYKGYPLPTELTGYLGTQDRGKL